MNNLTDIPTTDDCFDISQVNFLFDPSVIFSGPVTILDNSDKSQSTLETFINTNQLIRDALKGFIYAQGSRDRMLKNIESECEIAETSEVRVIIKYLKSIKFPMQREYIVSSMENQRIVKTKEAKFYPFFKINDEIVYIKETAINISTFDIDENGGREKYSLSRTQTQKRYEWFRYVKKVPLEGESYEP